MNSNKKGDELISITLDYLADDIDRMVQKFRDTWEANNKKFSRFFYSEKRIKCFYQNPTDGSFNWVIYDYVWDDQEEFIDLLADLIIMSDKYGWKHVHFKRW